MSSLVAEAVSRLHQDLDEAVSRVDAALGRGLRCGPGCTACCQDDLSVLEVEAARIRADHAVLLEQGAPGPPGACAFLSSSGRCRVYAARPYLCRTQGLPLLWFELDDAEEPVERRATCELNEPVLPPLSKLPDRACWVVGPWEERLLDLQEEHLGAVRRVSLRSLFTR